MASPDEIWLVDFGDPFPGEPAHHRPAVILGPPETFGPDFPFSIVSPMTTTRRGLPLHVEVEANEATGLDEDSYVQCELVRSINRKRLVHQLGVLDLVASQRVHDITRILLGHEGIVP